MIFFFFDFAAIDRFLKEGHHCEEERRGNFSRYIIAFQGQTPFP